MPEEGERMVGQALGKLFLRKTPENWLNARCHPYPQNTQCVYVYALCVGVYTQGKDTHRARSPQHRGEGGAVAEGGGFRRAPRHCRAPPGAGASGETRNESGGAGSGRRGPGAGGGGRGAAAGAPPGCTEEEPRPRCSLSRRGWLLALRGLAVRGCGGAPGGSGFGVEVGVGTAVGLGGVCVVLSGCDPLLAGEMKRRSEPGFGSPQAKQKKKVEDLGLTLSSTSDDEAQLSNHTTQGGRPAWV